MDFSFTLPELRAELRALGHDGIPDHLILTFLSQLNLPGPPPPPAHSTTSPSLTIPHPPPSSSPSSSSSSADEFETSSSCSDSSWRSHGTLNQARAAFADLECKRKFKQLAGMGTEEILGFNGRSVRVEEHSERAERCLYKANRHRHVGDGSRRINEGDHREMRKQKRSLHTGKKIMEDKEGEHQRKLYTGKMKMGEKAKRHHRKRSYTEKITKHSWTRKGDEYMRPMHRCKDLSANGETTYHEAGEGKDEYGFGRSKSPKMEKSVDLKSSKNEAKCGGLVQKMEICVDTNNSQNEGNCNSLGTKKMEKYVDTNSSKNGAKCGSVTDKMVKSVDVKSSNKEAKSDTLISKSSNKEKFVYMKSRKKEAECSNLTGEVQDCGNKLEKLSLSLGKKPWLLETMKDSNMPEGEKLEAMPAQPTVHMKSCRSMAMSKPVEGSLSSASSSSLSSSSSSSSASTEITSFISEPTTVYEINSEVSEETTLCVREGDRCENSTAAGIDECRMAENSTGSCIYECQMETISSQERSNSVILSASSTQIQCLQNPNNLTPTSHRQMITADPHHSITGFPESSAIDCKMLASHRGMEHGIGIENVRLDMKDGMEADCHIETSTFDNTPHSSEGFCDFDPSVCSKSSSGSYQNSRDTRINNVSPKPSIGSPSSRKHRPNGQRQLKRGGKIDRVERFAEMQKVWKKDSFLVSNDRGGKRKGVPSFHHVFSALHTDSCAIGTR